MTFSVLTIPPLLQIVVMLSIVIIIGAFSNPQKTLLVFFSLRVLFDLLWWVPGEVMSMNASELFTGVSTGVIGIIFIFEFKRFDWNPMLKWFVPFAMAMAIGLIQSSNFRASIEALTRFLSPFIMMFVVSGFFPTEKARKKLFLTIVLFSIIPIVTSLYHWANGQMSTYSLSGIPRLLGGYKNLHNHAHMMMFCASLMLSCTFVSRGTPKKLLFGGLTIAAVSCLYMTQVRTTQLSFIIFAVTYLWVSGQRKLTSALVIGVAIAVISVPLLRERFEDILMVFSDQTETNDYCMIGSVCCECVSWCHTPARSRRC